MKVLIGIADSEGIHTHWIDHQTIKIDIDYSIYKSGDSIKDIHLGMIGDILSITYKKIENKYIPVITIGQ